MNEEAKVAVRAKLRHAGNIIVGSIKLEMTSEMKGRLEEIRIPMPELEQTIEIVISKENVHINYEALATLFDHKILKEEWPPLKKLYSLMVAIKEYNFIGDKKWTEEK